MKTFRIEVFLENGTTLRTEDSFENSDEAFDTIIDHIEDRDSPWKGIGHLAVHFKSIVGISIEEFRATELKGVTS